MTYDDVFEKIIPHGMFYFGVFLLVIVVIGFIYWLLSGPPK
jgi:hypothetical protein